MNAAVVGQLRMLLVFQLLFKPQIASAGTCWSAMARKDRCTELLSETTTKEDCCSNHDVATAWSDEEYDPGTLFFWRTLAGGVPCKPCKESCVGVECGEGKSCAIRRGHPKCVCSPKCREHKSPTKGPVCGSDGRTYRSACRLRKRACQRQSSSLSVAYHGICQSSCDNIKCSSGKHCLLDQNLRPHCVRCARRCPTSPKRRQVCGSDGTTYVSSCHLREKACRSGKAIPIAYRGQCRANVTCATIRCKDQQTCLDDLRTGTPRCVTCVQRCPRPRHMAGPICGTNENTYHSWCHMIQDSCNRGYVIETKYAGKCNKPET